MGLPGGSEAQSTPSRMDQLSDLSEMLAPMATILRIASWICGGVHPMRTAFSSMTGNACIMQGLIIASRGM
jgi:hypothetical protein